jgi:hypothetical protein
VQRLLRDALTAQRCGGAADADAAQLASQLTTGASATLRDARAYSFDARSDSFGLVRTRSKT